MNTLVKIGAGVFAFVIFASMVSQCGKRNHITQQPPSQVQTAESTEIVLKEMAKGLDLKAVTELAKKCKSAEDFETRLNAQSEAVNNIDLNKDGKVDYINVTEYGTGNLRGFSLTTELSPGEVQEIATIEFEKDAENAKVQTTGNPSLYGPGQYQHSSFGITDALLMGWLFSNRPSYSSPYGHGNYPPAYGGGWGTRDSSEYGRTMSSRTAGSTMSSSSQSVLSKSTVSPNAEKTAAKARALTAPTQSQRSFGSHRSSGSSNTSTAGQSSRSNSSGSSQSARPNSSSSSSASPSRSGGFGRSSSSGPSRSGSFSRGGK